MNLSEDVFKNKIKECSLYFEKEISNEKIAIYWKHLKNRYDNITFEKKIDYLIKYDNHFPLIADIEKAPGF